jgi:hypothetical protein
MKLIKLPEAWLKLRTSMAGRGFAGGADTDDSFNVQILE